MKTKPDVCYLLFSGLGIYFPPGYSLPLNCSIGEVDSWANNVSFWPAVSNPLVYDNYTYDVPCSQPQGVTPPASIYCEAPLVEANTDNGRKCAFVCPLPSLSDAQYENAKLMQGIMGWFSWVIFIHQISLKSNSAITTGYIGLVNHCSGSYATCERVPAKPRDHDRYSRKHCGKIRP